MRDLLETLPTDIFKIILAYLDDISLQKLGMTCKRYAELRKQYVKLYTYIFNINKFKHNNLFNELPSALQKSRFYNSEEEAMQAINQESTYAWYSGHALIECYVNEAKLDNLASLSERESQSQYIYTSNIKYRTLQDNSPNDIIINYVKTNSVTCGKLHVFKSIAPTYNPKLDEAEQLKRIALLEEIRCLKKKSEELKSTGRIAYAECAEELALVLEVEVNTFYALQRQVRDKGYQQFSEVCLSKLDKIKPRLLDHTGRVKKIIELFEKIDYLCSVKINLTGSVCYKIFGFLKPETVKIAENFAYKLQDAQFLSHQIK